MDLVYVYKHAGDERELRFSLRSACKNLQFDQVVVVGDKPRFAREIEHIPCRGPANRYDNSFGKTMQAARTADISESFIHMNDDFFILRPFTEVPHLYMQTIGEWIAGYRRRRVSEYLEKAHRTMRITGSAARFYETHFPFVYEKQKLLELEAKYRLPCRIMPRTLYAFEHGIRGQQSNDFKAKSRAQVVAFSKQSFMSTSNTAARTKEFKTVFERLFPEPCRYEQEYAA